MAQVETLENEQDAATPLPPLRRSRLALAWAIAALALPTLLAAVATQLQGLWWGFDLLAHTRPQLALLLMLLAGAQVFALPRWPAAAWLAGTVVAAVPLLPLYWPAPPAAPGATPIAIAQVNLNRNYSDIPAVAAWLRSQAPDLVLLQEVTDENLAEIKANLGGYTVATVETATGSRGAAILVRDGFGEVTASILHPAHDPRQPMPQIAFEHDGVPLALLLFHTLHPFPAAHYAGQAAAYDTAATWANAQRLGGSAPIIAGDFNSTTQGRLMQTLMARANLAPARFGHGVNGTWPDRLPPFLRLGLDGGLIPPELTSTAFVVGPDIGSDHRPILMRVARR